MTLSCNIYCSEPTLHHNRWSFTPKSSCSSWKKKNPPKRKKRTLWWERETFFNGFKCWIISPRGEGFHTAEDQTHAELADDGLHLHARQGRKQHHTVGLFPCTCYIWLRLAVNISFAQQDIWLPVNPDSIRLKSLADDSTVWWNFKLPLFHTSTTVSWALRINDVFGIRLSAPLAWPVNQSNRLNL